MFITPEELYTHLYEESIKAISGNDTRLLEAAIDGAVVEAKGYLHKFDLDKIFNVEDNLRNALLLIFVKDIAVWHYINIARPSVDIDLRAKRYDAAIAWLKGVQQEKIIPNLPARRQADGTEENASGVLITSNPKRTQHI